VNELLLIPLANLVILAVATAYFIQSKRGQDAVMDEITSQHRKDSYVATIRGLVTLLHQALEDGGLDPEHRRRIYEAINEQLDTYDHAVEDARRRRERT
jgi:hypothetical protein